MELYSTTIFTTEFFLALLSIVIIDLVLAGDNAIVIGMAARSVPAEIQKRVILIGTVAAIVIRTVLIVFVSWLLQIPFLLAMGGILLIWIAYNLMVEEKKEHNVKNGTGTLAAIRTILIADVVMSLDNVLAIAGASHGSFLLVVIGLLISIPIMIWGSSVILQLIERYPFIVYIGAAVLAFTAARMIVDEPRLAAYFDSPIIHWGFIGAVVAGVLLLGRARKAKVTSGS